MSGAGETKTKAFEVAGSDGMESHASHGAAVRMYWRKGMVWTVHRTGAARPRGWSGASRRALARLRDLRTRVMRFLLQPWP
jgi:hypothetical protein